MWFRRLILKLMWLSPVILLACIAVHARTYEDPFVPQATDPVQQKRILALKDLVIESDKAVQRKADGAAILELMDRWKRTLNESKEGRLIPIGADDTTSEGAKSEIFKSSASLSIYLMDIGQIEAKSNPGRALDYYRACLENSELLKYMDVNSVRSAVLNERRAVRLIEQIPADAKVRGQAANFLACFLKEQRNLQDIDQLSEDAFNRSRERAEMDLVSLRGTKLDLTRADRKQKRTFGGAETNDLVLSLRMTHYTQSTFESLLRETIGKLSG